MKSITKLFMIVVAIGMFTGCQSNNFNEDMSERSRVESVKMYNRLQNDPINSAIITQSTIYPHHFITHTPTLNALGKKDLDVLAHHYINDVMPVTTSVDIVSDVHVYFDYNKSNLRSESTSVLDTAIKVLQENPHADILITGHTDVRGSDDYNIKLGERRADSVDQYMTANGVDPTRVRIISRGRMDALSSESSEEGMQKDRNAHFVVAEIQQYPVALNVRQGGVSDDLYHNRKKNTLSYLASKGVDTSLIHLADNFAGGEGLASEQVFIIVTTESSEVSDESSDASFSSSN